MTALLTVRPEMNPAIPPIRITDGLMDSIRGRLAAVSPERGGAILATGDLMHLLIEDSSGRYGRASWDISAQLSATIGEIETAGHGTLVGTVHTHPAGIPDPSSTDVATTLDALNLNPHLDGLMIAVVTEGAPREHDLPLGDRHRMSLHLLRRDVRGQMSLARVRGEVVPLAADLAAAGINISSAASISSWRRAQRATRSRLRSTLPTVVSMNYSPRLVVRVPGSGTAMLFIHPSYPLVGPIAVAARPTSASTANLQPLPSPWDPVAPPGPQLTALVRTGAGRRIVGSTKRVWPLVGTLAGRRVLVAGGGSVGSRIAEDLVRSGVGALTVIDPDQVEAPNLARTIYSAADIGLSKPDALARRLQAIDPAVVVDSHVSPVGEIDLTHVLAGVSLVVAATDDMAEQALLAHHAYAAGVPLVACALYKKAAAGEVVISVPSVETACWTCAVGTGTAAEAYRPRRDYGLGGRLVGEAALGPSIHLVAGVAATVALGLLAGPRSRACRQIRRLLAQRRTLGLIATAPRWDFFKDLFAGMEHQHAPQSVWVRVDRSPDCPVCGPKPLPPLSSQAGIDLTEIIRQYRRGGKVSSLPNKDRNDRVAQSAASEDHLGTLPTPPFQPTPSSDSRKRGA